MALGRLFNFAARTGLLMAFRVCGAAAMFAVNLGVARHYGADGLGVFALCTAAVALLAVLLAMGFPSVAPYLTAEYESRRQPAMLRGLVKAGAGHILAGMALALVVGAILLPFLGLDWHEVLLAGSVWLTAGGIAFLYLFGAVATGMKRQLRGLAPETMIRPLAILAALGLVIWVVPAIPLWGFMVLFSIATWIAVLGGAWMLRADAARIYREDTDTDLPRWRRAAYPWTATALMWDFLIDVILLTAGFFAPSVEIAMLHACFRFRVLGGFGMRSLYLMLLPDIASLKALGETQSMHRRLAQANLAAVVYGVAVICVFFIFGRTMLGWFGPQIAAAYPILLIVGATIPVRAIFGPAPAILAMHDRHMISACIMGGGLVLALAMIWILYPLLGIAGVATAYLTACTVVSVLLWLHARSRIGVDCSVFSVLGRAGYPSGVAVS